MATKVPSQPSPQLTISLPQWLPGYITDQGTQFADDRARMALAIGLSRENVVHGGSPFGAVVFAGPHVVAGGVNCVLDAGFSIAHAEIVALMHAQHVLAQPGAPEGPYTLYSSAEPCCQCFGAVFWSNISRLVCGAHRSDTEAIGFDEGPKPDHWAQAMQQYGIEVEEGLLRTEAAAVIRDYAAQGGPVYGRSRQGC